MSRFVCVSCRKKRDDKFLAVKARFIVGSTSSICVDCWEKRFNCDKSKLIFISYNYENILLHKKESPLGKTLTQ